MSGAPSSLPTPLPTIVDTRMDGTALGYSCAIYGGLGLLVMFIYVFVRKYVRSKYSPRANYVSKEEVVPDLPYSLWRWIVPLMHPSKCDDLVLSHVGLDAYVTIRFLNLGFKLFLILCPTGMLILVPVYATQGSKSNLAENSPNSDLDHLTMAFISNNVPLQWLPCFFVYVFTAIGIGLLHREYLKMIPLQREFFLQRHRSTYTVLVERIPENICSRKALRRYFESIYPDTVLDVNIVPMDDMTKSLKDKIDDREDVVARLERALMEEEAARKKDPDTTWRSTHVAFESDKAWMGLRGFCSGYLCRLFGQGNVVNSVDYYQQQLDTLNKEIVELQDQVRTAIYRRRDNQYEPQTGYRDASMISKQQGDDDDAEEVDDWRFSEKVVDEAEWLLGDHEYTGDVKGLGEAAFITFKSKTASTAVSRAMISEDNKFIIQPAPEPGDVNWKRLGCHPGKLLVIRIAVVLLNLILLILFGVLTSTISATTNVENIRNGWPTLDTFLEENPWAVQIFRQIAPLLLVIAFALVPPLLNLILELRFELSESAKENSFFLSYYVFLVVQMFLFYQFSGAIFTVLTQSIENPRHVVNVLSQAIQQSSVFFMQFITIRMFWVLPVELIRLSDIVVAAIVRPVFCGFAKTPREMKNDKCGCRTFGFAGDAWHGLICAHFALILTISVTYAVMAPLVLVFGLVYFTFALMVWRNQMLYVYVKHFESGGSNWNRLAVCYLFAFMLLQMTMLGIFALNEAAAQSVLMLVPFIITVAYAIFIGNFDHSGWVSLSDARKFDIHSGRNPSTTANDQVEAESANVFEAERKAKPLNYEHPCLKQTKRVEPESVDNMVQTIQRLENNKRQTMDSDETTLDQYQQVDSGVASNLMET